MTQAATRIEDRAGGRYPHGFARDMEEHMHIVQCLETGFRNCTLLPSCVLKTALAEARASFLETLDRYTLADLAKPGTGRGGNAVLRRMSRPKALA